MNETVQQQLHSFCLPEELISSLQTITAETNYYQPQEQSTSTIEEETHQENDNLLSFSCTVCNSSFDSNELQRQHFRSDWHRFNLKLSTRSTSHKPIDQAKFTNMLEDLQDSLSGSDSESDSSNDSGDSNPDDKNQNHQNLGFKSSKQFKESASTINLEDRFQELISISEEPSLDSNEPIRLLSPSSPLIWFTASNLESPSEDDPIVQLGFYRSIFPNSFSSQDRSLAQEQDQQQQQQADQYKAELKALQRPFLASDFTTPSTLEIDSRASLPTWTILMIGGGHFAAMVISTIPKLRHIGKNKPPEIEPVILLHKTFHRYTTRRKQGGGQASHDAGGKGAAKSAGASLRRYNEQTLFQDIQALLKAWNEPISQSDLVFIRSSKSNLKTFFKNKDEPDGYKLTRGDPRVRSLPFVTKRPTFNELKRCFNELTRVKIIKTTRREMAEKEKTMREIYEREKTRRELQLAKKLEQEERQRAEEERKRQERIEQTREKTAEEKEQELEDSRWERAVEMVKKGKLEALQEFVEKHNQTEWFGRVPVRVSESTDVSGGYVSLLQLASMADQPTMVEWMLESAGSDPTIVGSRTGSNKAHLTAYELAPSRLTRNAFRRAMAKNPSQWDWISKAKVPSALTEELETNQSNKNKEWNKKLKERLKERDRVRAENEKAQKAKQLQQQEEEEERNSKAGSGAQNKLPSGVNRLGGGSTNRKTPAVVSNPLAGLSEEQRMRLERERRARAAEARLK
ncbi:hypothetical protein PGT21_004681 [Puccinia graminis f. sp. tritici]|uniref:VLRF1 domain-containing protein n=2 Tax=Puccinia graminis f. sp. tritici TaxID=56615 RepID=E3KZ73_PUCGT|nr:uncharacterized protein PGTG_15747 [Puccinia graminis f. sp. tritici CRL 75-36-700-3]EFP89598.1 hypothetical protein PGTG_15747 [Puccinia graminis f. sp. tritici CRL 75-36-700-3]KAA1074418.1 hypothetical protein PGT21_004681 [Puccinia graminis f. sp. tritici]